MSDSGTFQSGTLATMPPGLVVATDYRPVPGGGSAHYQRMVLDIGPDGTTVPLAWGGTGMPLGTLAGGTVQTHGTSQVLGSVRVLDGGTFQVHGTLQALGTVQPLAGSVHPATPLPGTSHITGTVQPLAGSVHLASGLPGTAQVLGSVRILDPAAVTQSGAWAVSVSGTVQGLGTYQPLAGSVHVANVLSGTFQPHGTGQVLGTIQPLAGSVHLANAITGTVQTHGTSQVLGSVRVLDPVDVTPAVPAANDYLPVRLTDGNAFYTASGGAGGSGIAYSDESPFLAGGSIYTPVGGFVTSDAVPDGSAGAFAMTAARALHVAPQGTTQVLGTVQTHGTSQVLGSVRSVGTTEVLGTVQPLAGSVHLANAITGTVQTHGTSQVLGTVAAAGQVAHGAVAAGAPLLMAAFGSSGTQAGVDDGDVVRLWADLNGRLQVIGSVTTAPTGTQTVLGTVQTHGTSQVLGSVRSVGTTEALGTVQPLAGSVHLASFLPGGSVSAQGYVAHGAAAAGNPVLLGAFGSSGGPTAVDEQDAVRLWADLAGRLQVVGSVTATGTVQTHGTSQALGTVQPLAGSVHLASFLPGGTVQTHGTSQALGTFQPLAGSVHPAAALPGTSQVSGTVQVARLSGEGRFGTVFTGAVTNGTLVPAPAQGTYVRVWDLLISGSTAGTAWLELGDGTRGPGIFAATNGGLSFNSARGYRTNGTSHDVLFNCSAGSWSVFIAWSVET